MGSDARVIHSVENTRFEVLVGEELAGYSEYVENGSVRTFDHTVTLPQFRGRGLAAVVTEFALDDTRRAGMTVVPACWYVRDFIESNKDKYGDLVDR